VIQSLPLQHGPTHAPIKVPPSPPPAAEADGLPAADAEGDAAADADAGADADGAVDDEACGDPQAPTTSANIISAAAGRRMARTLNTHLLLECE